MKPDPTLRRLAALRRQSEQQALAAVMQQDALCRRAEKLADTAAGAVTLRTAEARASERKLVGPLVGRLVSPTALVRVQTELDRLALETARLRAAAANAQASLLDQRGARAKAHANFRLRQRAAAHLDLLLKQEAVRLSRRDTAVAEADEADRAAATAGRRSS